MADREKVIKGLQGLSGSKETMKLIADAIALLRDQNEIIDALLKVGYPHNFQRESPWVVNYMWSITDVVKKAVHLRDEEVKQDD